MDAELSNKTTCLFKNSDNVSKGKTGKPVKVETSKTREGKKERNI